MFGAVGDWTQQRVAAVVAPSSLTDCLPWTAVLRARASVDGVARSELRASSRRRVRAGCAVCCVCCWRRVFHLPARHTVASRDFGSLRRSNFSSPKFALKPCLHATSVHRMNVCAAVKLQTRRTDLARTDSQSWVERETFRGAVSWSIQLCFTRSCHAVVCHRCVNMPRTARMQLKRVEHKPSKLPRFRTIDVRAQHAGSTFLPIELSATLS